MIEVELSNGTVLEFPDGMSQDQIKSAIDKNFGSGKPQGQENIIGTTEDGGRIMRADDGTLSFASPAFSTNDQEAIQRVMAGDKFSAIAQERLDDQRIAENPVAARGQEFIKGLPFVGEFADEAVGAVSPEAGENMRRTSDAMQRRHPRQTAALNIAGGVAGSVPLIAGGAAVAVRAPGMIGKTAAAGSLGATGGAIEGAVSGFGSGEDMESRQKASANRAMIGAGLGGLVGAAAPLVGTGARALVRRIKGVDFRAIADEFGIDPKTARAIKGFLVNDDLDAAARRISEIGDDAMLADAGIGTAQALDTAMASGGRALKVGRENIEARAQQAGGRLNKQLDNILGISSGIKNAAKAISKKSAPARQAAFDRVYASPIDYSSAAGRNVESVLDRIPPETMQAAVKEANAEMISKSLRNEQIIAKIGDDGAVTFESMPNARQLDMLKRKLGEIAESQKDEFGRLTGAGIRSSRLAGELRDALTDAVPSYRTALKLGGDKIAEDNALRMGRDMLTRRVKLEDVRAAMKGAPKDVKEAAKRGLREGIEETLSNVRRTITDPNTDAREAMQLVKEVSSRANLSKLRMVLGKNGADLLLSELDKATAALELRALVSTNSKTAVRQFGQAAVDEATGPGVTGTLARGEPIEAAKQAVQALTGATDASSVAQREQIFGQIAEVLTQTRGKDAERAIQVVQRALQGQPMKDAEAEFLIRVVGVPTFSAIHQSGQQLLESR